MASASVAFSPDGTTLASSRDETVWLWDVASGQQIAGLEGHTGWVESVAFSPDGTTLASGGGSWDRDNTVRLWDVASGQEITVLEGHTDWVKSVAFSPDGTTLASGSRDDTVRLWDVASGEQIAGLEGHWVSVRSVAFSPDGTTLASGGDTTVRLWDVASGQQIAVLETPDLSGPHDPFVPFVYSVAFSPDGTTLASSDDTAVWLWDVAGGQQIAVLESGGGGLVAFSPDGTTLASGHGDGTVLLWDMSPYVTPLAATAIDTSPSLPGQTALLDNYPNPFNSRTRIAYRLAAPGRVRLSIYNTLGQPVRTLVDGSQAAGAHRVAWDALDGQGAAVSSGVYVTRLEYPGGVQTRRLVHLR